MAGIAREALEGAWRHAHEEDGDDELVFRPASHPLPPARGRQGFELRGDGTAVESTPGPVDVPVERAGSWSLEGDRLRLDLPGAGSRAWQVAAAEPDRLVLRRPAE